MHLDEGGKHRQKADDVEGYGKNENMDERFDRGNEVSGRCINS